MTIYSLDVLLVLLEAVCCFMSSSNCCFLTCIQISQEAGQVVCYSHLLKNVPQFVVIHTVKGFGIVNKAEIDVFLELSCFFYDPADVGNLISGSSALSKSSSNIWKFSVHVLLKTSLENFEHYFAGMWNECNCVVVWTFFGIAFSFGIGMTTEVFQSCGHWWVLFCFFFHCWVFQTCWRIECSTFTASSFRVWNRSTGIPSPPLALLVVMLPEAHMTLHSRMSGSRWVITPLWLSVSLRPFWYSSVFSCHLKKKTKQTNTSASVRCRPFVSFYCTPYCMKCSLDISNFLEEISSLSHFIIFLYFFALII